MSESAALATLSTATPAQRLFNALLFAVAAADLAASFRGRRVPDPALVEATLERGPLVGQPTPALRQAITVAEHLGRRRDLNEDELARALAATHEAGDTGGTAAVLAAIGAGTPWREATFARHNGQGSYGPTAALRAFPAALLPDIGIGSAVQLARRSSVITHTHLHARDGAAALTAAVWLAARGLPATDITTGRFVDVVIAQVRTADLRGRLDIVRTLVRHGAGPHEVAATVGNDARADRAVPAAIAAHLCHPDQPFAAIRFAILIGGDTPCIAAMTAAIAGARLPDIAPPSVWGTHPATGRINQVASTYVSGKR